MKLTEIVFILTLVIIFGIQTSFACQCFTPPPCSSYWKFDTVFVGTVKNVENVAETNNFMPKVEVEVEQNFKGMKSKKAFTQNYYGNSCAWSFEKDDKFLFYGNLAEKKENYFSTGYCTRTQRFEENLSDFDYFKTLNSSTPNFWIWGTISRGYRGSPIQGVKAEVLDNKKRLLGISDKYGDIKFSVSEEGKYRVRVYIPKGAVIAISQLEEQRDLLKRRGRNKKGRFVEYEIEVKNNQCGWFDTTLYGFKK